MAAGILADCFFYELGHSDFIHSFFSTISYHLEEEGWGTKYPLLMNELYNGKLVSVVKAELFGIEKELSKQSPADVIWEKGDISKMPPW
ncbi:hypothetical protein EVU96_12790 [Bacillus infantis]|uniref:Imm70 family immunity protein n=1 Tax=Bacillus infantis TaxID=324767 RepID=UPI00101C40B8|nr:Imm70 family immunity protein [Bacillus infantis]RYI28804.1 hypothetical protein EVU96_12790 [Bacillus infantis]